uniref:Protein kinase domain-containing protein n=1 Tax=Cannabis sativa TaxID=3483 RepID=A0A803P0D0_CANSA
MSNHKNVLKLLGYCLDSKFPMLVYEFPVHGNLSHFLIDGNNSKEPPPPRLPFESRLRTGIGIANALAYLHHGHSKTFIHREIFKEAVYLDQDYGAKLFDFQSSIPIPDGETHVDVDLIEGTMGHMSPENGGAVLEQTILLFNGKSNPLRSYSSHELNMATHNFNPSQIIHASLNYTLYKGSVIVNDDEEEEISVKMFFPKFNNERHLKMIANEVAVASQMSNHRNVLKLLGYCLDSELPMLVYELPFHGNLLHISELAGQAPFERKLKICIGIANAISYLHHGHSKTFINRDIRRGQVFLDKDYNAKLCSFYVSIPIPEGETHVDADFFGTKGFTPPEVAKYGRYTERSDVYDFGILLSELLTGKTWGQILWDITDGSSNYDWNELPMLVYDHFPIQGQLSRFLLQRNKEPPPRLPFETKLRIGIGVANAVAYLHHGHSKTFINRLIHSTQVLLDKDYGPKLYTFYGSIPIPEGETHVDVDRIFGIFGFISPEAGVHGRFTERSDVYAFGVLLSELLTGKSWLYMADPATWIDGPCAYWFDAWKNELKVNTLREEGEEETRLQIMECAKLVEMCIEENVDERPDMVEVAKALIFIKTNKTLLP